MTQIDRPEDAPADSVGRIWVYGVDVMEISEENTDIIDEYVKQARLLLAANIIEKELVERGGIEP